MHRRPAGPAVTRFILGTPLFVIGLVVVTLAMPFARDTSARQATVAVSCDPAPLAAGWTGSDTVRCLVSAGDREVNLSCESAPAGVSCQFERATVVSRSGSPAAVAMTVSYTEQLPFGRFPFRLEARSGDVVGAAPLLLVKDANTVTAKCPTPGDIAAIDRDVRLWFDGDPTGGTKDCSAGPRPLTVMQSRVYRALTTMRRLQFAEPLPWTREPLYRWFVRTVRGIRFRTDIPISAAGPDRTIQIRSAVQNGSGFALAMTDRVPGGGDFRIYETFLALLVHEARHVDGKPHTCGTKDRTERELGAWGAQRALHLWMVNHTPPDFMRPELQVVSRQIATQMCAYAFCEPCRN